MTTVSAGHNSRCHLEDTGTTPLLNLGQIQSGGITVGREVQETNHTGGGGFKNRDYTLASATLNLEVLYETGGAAQKKVADAAITGTKLDVEFYPEGTGSGSLKYIFTAVIEEVPLEFEVNGFYNMSFTLMSDGIVTKTTV